MTTYTGNKMLSAMKGQPRRKKALLGDIIGAVGQLASTIGGAVSKKKQQRKELQTEAADYGNNYASALTQSLQNQGEIENEYLDKITLKNGGGMKLNTKTYDRIGLAKQSKFSRGGRKKAADGTSKKTPVFTRDDVADTINGASGFLNAAMESQDNSSGATRTNQKVSFNTKTGIETPEYETDENDYTTYDRLEYNQMRRGGKRPRAKDGIVDRIKNALSPANTKSEKTRSDKDITMTETIHTNRRTQKSDTTYHTKATNPLRRLVTVNTTSNSNDKNRKNYENDKRLFSELKYGGVKAKKRMGGKRC